MFCCPSRTTPFGNNIFEVRASFDRMLTNSIMTDQSVSFSIHLPNSGALSKPKLMTNAAMPDDASASKTLTICDACHAATGRKDISRQRARPSPAKRLTRLLAPSSCASRGPRRRPHRLSQTTAALPTRPMTGLRRHKWVCMFKVALPHVPSCTFLAQGAFDGQG
jgi:hypothetical protein